MQKQIRIKHLKKQEFQKFSVGDKAHVIDVGRDNKVINTGTIVMVAPMYVIFEGPSDQGTLFQWKFERKGTNWVQSKKDYAHLVPVEK